MRHGLFVHVARGVDGKKGPENDKMREERKVRQGREGQKSRHSRSDQTGIDSQLRRKASLNSCQARHSAAR
jgi:hypothetical protein